MPTVRQNVLREDGPTVADSTGVRVCLYVCVIVTHFRNIVCVCFCQKVSSVCFMKKDNWWTSVSPWTRAQGFGVCVCSSTFYPCEDQLQFYPLRIGTFWPVPTSSKDCLRLKGSVYQSYKNMLSHPYTLFWFYLSRFCNGVEWNLVWKITFRRLNKHLWIISWIFIFKDFVIWGNRPLAGYILSHYNLM